MTASCCTLLLHQDQNARLQDWNRALTCVELRGFEPLTPSMRTRCATGLRYSPKNASQRSKLRDLSAPGDRRAVRAVAQITRTAPGVTGRTARTVGGAGVVHCRLLGSVAHGADFGVGVLVVELVAGLGGQRRDVDDLGGRLRRGSCLGLAGAFTR